jgi:hypothetical protein
MMQMQDRIGQGLWDLIEKEKKTEREKVAKKKQFTFKFQSLDCFCGLQNGIPVLEG